MARPNGAFEFINGPVHHRTKRIEPEAWEKWRPLITELFLEVKLAEVVTRMQMEHGFCANERQYAHHLSKWGVKKQGRGTKTTATPSPAQPDDTPAPVLRSILKRRRPSASIHSVSSGNSASSKPPKKRVEQDTSFPSKDEPEVSPEDSGHIWVECSSPGAAVTSPSDTNTSSYISIDSPETVRPAIGPPDTLFIPSDGVAPIARSSPIGVSRPTPFRPVHAIHPSRPVETFSTHDIADIKLAAECLSMFSCNQEAFELYTTILKGQLADHICRGKNFWYLIIQCAHTADIPEHVEVIRNIIQAELARLQPPGSALRLLLYMLLAFISSRTPDAEDVALHMAKARAYLDQEGVSVIFQHLPPDDRSLDLAVYRNILRLQETDSYDFTAPTPFGLTPFGFGPENKLPFEDLILFQSPGPFELQKGGRMANPCIRSCIKWCTRTLLGCSIPITPGIMNLCTDGLSIAWAEANALFIILWEHWATYNSHPSHPESIWMTATQETMGISATELLLLVCRAIHDPHYPWNAAVWTSDGDLIQRLRAEAEDLSRQPDHKLARGILKMYVSRNTATLWPAWHSAVQRLEKARLMQFFESVLLVRFPRLGVTRSLITSVLITQEALGENPEMMTLREEDEESFPVVDKAPKMSPTIASSLSSMDLSTFRKAGISTMLRFTKLARGSLSTTSWSRSGFKMSIAGYSDISRSLRSMSISGESASMMRVTSEVMEASGLGVRKTSEVMVTS